MLVLKLRLIQGCIVNAQQNEMEAAVETHISFLLPQQKSSHAGPEVISSCFQTESCFQKLEHKNKLSSSPLA